MKSMREIFRSYAVLDSEGRHINGTDKESNHHYSEAYESLFQDHLCKGASTRETVRLMMEVGVADGSSLLAWSEIFPNARCVGFDIHIAEKISSGRYNNTEFHLGDQRSKEDCERAAGDRQFDFICEDATHLLDDSLRTLLYLWPFVKPGGLYVIEEFANIGALRKNVVELWPQAQIVNTIGPNGGLELLVVLRKPI